MGYMVSHCTMVRDDGITYGWYTVLLPDGFMYNYTYASGPQMGYMVSGCMMVSDDKITNGRYTVLLLDGFM